MILMAPTAGFLDESATLPRCGAVVSRRAASVLRRVRMAETSPPARVSSRQAASQSWPSLTWRALGTPSLVRTRLPRRPPVNSHPPVFRFSGYLRASICCGRKFESCGRRHSVCGVSGVWSLCGRGGIVATFPGLTQPQNYFRGQETICPHATPANAAVFSAAKIVSSK
jgi:hypothetical protein